jgi:predicted TIM-barrel fold metal-dependent hydrolase
MTRRQLASTLVPIAALAQSGPTRVIDAHNHLTNHNRATWAEDDRKLIEAADKLQIHQLCCSILPPERPTTLDGFRACNRWLLEAIQRFPGRVLGYCFVNPGYGQAALDEIRRYVEDHGFIGVKLYNDYRATDPVLAPLYELAAKLRIPILYHAGHTSWLPSPQLRAAPSVYFDTSGSVAYEGTVELAVRTLGAGRVLFACDLSMTASVGRIRGAEISDVERRQILGENMQRILARRRA